jgi:hypothetical protein
MRVFFSLTVLFVVVGFGALLYASGRDVTAREPARADEREPLIAGDATIAVLQGRIAQLQAQATQAYTHARAQATATAQRQTVSAQATAAAVAVETRTARTIANATATVAAHDFRVRQTADALQLRLAQQLAQATATAHHAQLELAQVEARAAALRAEIDLEEYRQVAMTRAWLWQALWVVSCVAVSVAGLGVSLSIVLWFRRRALMVYPNARGQWPLLVSGYLGGYVTACRNANHAASAMTTYHTPSWWGRWLRRWRQKWRALSS